MRRLRAPQPRRGAFYGRRSVGSGLVSSEPIAGTRACSRTYGRAADAAAMEHNPNLNALDALAALRRGQAELMEQIRLSQERVERSQELLKRIDHLLGKPPLKP